MPKKKTDETQEEGAIFVTSWGRTYTAPKIDAQKIEYYADNVYIAGALQKQQRVLFNEKYKVQGINPEGKPDEDLTNALSGMCESQEVRLWYAIQTAWLSVAKWGPYLINPVWGYDGKEYRLLKIRHLPSESFQGAAATYSLIKNELLPGIIWNTTTNEPEFHQKQSDGIIKKLNNVFMLTDPLQSTIVGGRPLILPLIPIVTMLDFSWQAVMQQVNRIGAGGLFYVKVTQPKGDDKEYARKILANISKNTPYQLRENMTAERFPIDETATAADTIDALDRLMSSYFSPSREISKDGTLIGGSSQPELDLYMSYIRGTHTWLEEGFEQLLQPYLEPNGWSGYRIHIEIPSPTIDKSELWVKQGELGARYGGITINELRAKIGESPLPGEEGNRLIEPSTAPSLGLQKAEVLAKFIHPIDPYGVVSRKGQKSFVQKTLGIEEGEAE